MCFSFLLAFFSCLLLGKIYIIVDFIRSIQAAELHAAEQNTLLAEENARFAKLRADHLEKIAVSDPGDINK